MSCKSLCAFLAEAGQELNLFAAGQASTQVSTQPPTVHLRYFIAWAAGWLLDKAYVFLGHLAEVCFAILCWEQLTAKWQCFSSYRFPDYFFPCRLTVYLFYSTHLMNTYSIVNKWYSISLMFHQSSKKKVTKWEKQDAVKGPSASCSGSHPARHEDMYARAGALLGSGHHTPLAAAPWGDHHARQVFRSKAATFCPVAFPPSAVAAVSHNLALSA